VALTVTFTVCDAQQIGLSSSGIALSAGRLTCSLPSTRPEQKSPPDLSPLRVSNQTFASRKQAPGEPKAASTPTFRYAIALPACPAAAPSPEPKSGEITRGPPLMDPPIFC
jgi:hypothetical protein